MSEHKHLQKAIRQMADGSKSGFYTFYLGSAQFVYSSALLLYGEHMAACNFMVDFYQYLYLHLPEYTPSQDLEKWISRLIMDRFGQLSIGKSQKMPSVKEQMNAGITLLEQNERERVWRLLERRMHFPKETPKKRGRGRLLLLITLLLLFVLLLFHFREPLLERLRTVLTQTGHTDEKADDGTDGESGESDGNNLPQNLPADADDNPDSPIPEDDAEGAYDGQMPDGSVYASDKPTVNTPQTPAVDTPVPETPTVPEPTADTPTVNKPTQNSPLPDQRNRLSGTQDSLSSDLENLELESHYGDSLTK